ncbi:hypothetical protein EN836_19560 [Mesorhizobium sp. M1C.F.Ca.ET.193.01.1.1]|uniref:type II toxin-antitoxin system HicB family antitoxin n=1 Tax=unclassified Mesorhizobium TaxID=325217 RepID=UPI000FD4A8FF|nr:MULTISPECIES: type II toxin-antitoxin system HicB family antitoxin [unclassified Mesorhizobium]TGS97160.1 hypothetical protein EN820_39650 [bacterium M00.F.Ca.ET.177.01.1.1]TGQ52321.1 hypothetical protein EN853_19555 [Mesorhizobium sp. M1C.F.Ca.ET.210.01.1.1]TGQ68951.1 hypothetical protein EN855_019565 [Mesorhizobium sp. M1C.F.Ca.ET.212.01.1.1]TGR04504.1 hypothetical protein EN847_19560 [Mesorhizobium sp. M1C.F.Ca.ET.204.01.1.1]TGR25271.1 hypothetical protein EN839_19560 [Mesorhizobium sp. 
MRRYVGLIHKETGSDYGVSFPDFPGVVSAGASVGEALELAEQALALHVAGIVEDGETIPDPSSLDQVLTISDHSALIAVTVPLKTG